MWIANAMLQIKVRLGSLEGLDPDVVDEVVRLAVAEKVKRPDSATQVDVAVDDARVSRRYESSTGRVTILPEWWLWLSPSSGKGKAFVIDTAPKSSVVTWRQRPDLWTQWFWPGMSLDDPIPEGLL